MGENTYKTYILHGLISRIYKGFYKSARKTDNPVEKWAKNSSRHVTKDPQMASKLMKKLSILLVIKGM